MAGRDHILVGCHVLCSGVLLRREFCRTTPKILYARWMSRPAQTPTPRAPAASPYFFACLSVAAAPVAAALVALASQLHAQPLSMETAQLRAACYHALGEAILQDLTFDLVNFAGWFQSELRGLLQPAQGQVCSILLESQSRLGAHTFGKSDLQSHPAEPILRMRVVWLVGVCGRSLPATFWGDAFALLTHHILAYDVVVGLTAVFGLSNLATMVMEENAVRI